MKNRKEIKSRLCAAYRLLNQTNTSPQTASTTNKRKHKMVNEYFSRNKLMSKYKITEKNILLQRKGKKMSYEGIKCNNLLLMVFSKVTAFLFLAHVERIQSFVGVVCVV